MMKVVSIMLLGAIISITAATVSAIAFSERVTVNPALTEKAEFFTSGDMGDYQ